MIRIIEEVAQLAKCLKELGFYHATMIPKPGGQHVGARVIRVERLAEMLYAHGVRLTADALVDVGGIQQPLPCLVCGKTLQSIGDPEQPKDAVMCHTYGNYGSTVFDSITGRERLDFNVCDECLRSKIDRTREVRKT